MPTADAPPAARRTFESTGAPPPARLPAVDLARGLAIVAMAAYHFCWDLETFGGVWLDMQDAWFWRLARYLIAGSFLFLVGVGLVLATRRGSDWPSLSRRIARIALGAAAVTVVTFVVMRQGFIFFGILHAIALFSLIGLAALRLPAWANALLGLAVIALAFVPGVPLFDHPALLWIGLGTIPPFTNDYEPIFPWLGPVLLGVAAGRVWLDAGAPTGTIEGGLLGRWLRWLGRNALVVYLLHQPLMIGALMLVLVVTGGGSVRSSDPAFEAEVAACLASQGDVGWTPADSEAYCQCMVRRIAEDADFPRGDAAAEQARAMSFVQGCLPKRPGANGGG